MDRLLHLPTGAIVILRTGDLDSILRTRTYLMATDIVGCPDAQIGTGFCKNCMFKRLAVACVE